MRKGRLTKEQMVTAVKWLDSKAPLIGKCSVCGDRNWSIGSYLVQTPLFGPPDVFQTDDSTYPFFILECQNCANSHLINAVISGIVRHPEQDDEK